VLSVLSGLDRRLKWLSVFNLGLAIVVLAFVLVAGPTLFIIRSSSTQPGATCRS